MHRPPGPIASVALLACALVACEELPPGALDARLWPAAGDVGVDAALDASPDEALDLDPVDLARPPDLDLPPDMAPPPPICARGDVDGDGYGQHPDCPTPDCDEANRAVRPGAPEACNGLDEDCDGVIDEGLQAAVCGVGACRREVLNCIEGRPTRCQPGAPTDEICNGVDDDCDGAADEDAATAVCGQGACRRIAACVDGVEAPCAPAPPADEICNRADDDCDGRTDEGHLAAVVVTAYSTLVGHHDTCDGGNQRIGSGCSAAINRFCGGQGCATTGFGPVENSGDTAVVTCVASVEARVVPFADLAAHHGPCDGQNQRIGPDCNAAIHRWCRAQGFVSGFGPRESGPDAVHVACVGEGAEARGTTYAALAGHHQPCDGNWQRIGPDCNAAIHRWCRAQGFESGFGPVENFGGDATVTCLRR